MSSKEHISVSVRTLVEFAFRSGDVVVGTPGAARFIEGIRGHQAVQAAKGDRYSAEVSLSTQVEGNHCVLEISGRADGVERNDDGDRSVVEEIKTTENDLAGIHENDHPTHWAQAKLYAYMIAVQDNLQTVTVRLTYYELKSDESKTFEIEQDRDELTEFWISVIEGYVKWTDRLCEHRAERAAAIAGLEFPFPAFRTGQREMAENVFETMRECGSLFLQAPTGIGKTIGVLYPALKALQRDHVSKIFYLTAKTVGRILAEDTLRFLEQANAKSITLTAKSKICFILEEGDDRRPPCAPETCSYSKGHYARVQGAVEDIFQESVITRETVEMHAQKHHVCPFEFSLDVALWTDVVICDYNYAFDPRAQLQRFFLIGRQRYCFLIDEAHNLVDRARDMYSARLAKRAVLSVKRAIKPHHPDLADDLGLLNTELLSLKKQMFEIEEPESGDGKPWKAELESPAPLTVTVKRFLRNYESALGRRSHSSELLAPSVLDFYFELFAFARVLESYDESYLTLYTATKSDLRIKLSCIDPAKQISSVLKTGASSIFFSATLSPMRYYMRLLGGDGDTNDLVLPSPFPREHLCLFVDTGISTRYKNRNASYEAIADRIHAIVSAKIGNYLIYFPSYDYLSQVLLRFEHRYGDPERVRIVSQQRGMTEAAREQFLANFTEEPTTTMVAFAVMGGIFAEAIDLRGERLSGAVVVGVGLPRIEPEREIIRHYFDERGESGFSYAYTYPGFNRVQQSAGRVIRTSSDRGVILLIDDRYAHEHYMDLFPAEWFPFHSVDDETETVTTLRSFWSD